MNRNYTRHQFLETVERLRAFSSDFTFTTDIIVGFPGETNQDFEATLDIMRQVRFAKVHMFPYSARKRTRAALYPNQIASEVIEERKQRVLRMAEEMAFALRQPYVGKRIEVLLEGPEQDFFSSHSGNFLRVLVRGKNLHSNQLRRVRCTGNTPEGLVADAD